ncbi:hypothetical protein HDU96_007635 [Phlyctochytrium bullatum]|nr:hypothetical protein HDU96_007635 [Phlyctochytrium bullatum]
MTRGSKHQQGGQGGQSLDELIKAGGRMAEFHRHEEDDQFTVRVEKKDGKIVTFHNVDPADVDRIRTGFPNAIASATRQSGNLDQIIAAGGIITAVHDHEHNNNLSVYVMKPDDEVEMVFSNVSQAHLEKLKQNYPHVKERMEKLVDPEYEEQKLHASTTFLDIMKSGGRITDYHPTERGTYSIHCVSKDGVKYSYSSISDAHMREFLGEEFQPGESVTLGE